METINRIGLLGLLLALFSCEADKSPSRAGFSQEPQFFSKLNIDGHHYRWAAGLDDYKLHFSRLHEAGTDYFGVLLAQDSTSPAQALRLELWVPQALAPEAQPQQRIKDFLRGPLAIREPDGYLTDPYRMDYRFQVENQKGQTSSGFWFLNNQLHSKGDSLWVSGVDQRSQTELNLSWVPDSLLYGGFCASFLSNRMSTFAPAALQLSLIEAGDKLRVSPKVIEGELIKAAWRIQDEEWQDGLIFSADFPQDSIFLLQAEFEFSNGAFLHHTRILSRAQLPCHINIIPRRYRHSRKEEGRQISLRLTYYDQEGRAFSSAYRHSQLDFSVRDGLLSHYAIAGTKDSTSLYRFFFEAKGELRDAQGNKRSLEVLTGQMGLGGF